MTGALNRPEKWLVVKLADVGDLLTITPALARLRQARPDATVHVLTTAHSAPLLAGTGLADEVILFDKFAFDRPGEAIRPSRLRAGWRLFRRLRRERYDTALILHHLTTRFGALKYAALALSTGAPRRLGLDNGRGWFLNEQVYDGGFGAPHEVACWLRVVDAALGTEPSGPYTPHDHPLQLGISPEDRAWAESALPPHAAGPRLAIHTGSGGYSRARRWSAESFARVADALHERHHAQIVVVGGPDDDAETAIAAMNHQPVNLVSQTTLGQLGAVLASCEAFIGADSGVMHLAAAAGTRVVAIFGPSNPAAWAPWTDRAAVVRSAPLCSPCSYVLRTVGQREGCPARTCMRMVTPEDVIAAVEALLRQDSESPFATVKADAAPTALTANRVRILGVPIAPITWDDLRNILAEWIAGDRPHQICTTNPEFLMVAQRDVHFYTILNRADLCVADGIGLLWAARWLGSPLPDRITGSDGLPLIAGWAAEAGWKLFLLGAAEGVATRAADILRERFPGLRIVGAYAGSPAPAEEDAIVAMVNASGADLLFVAYGAPRQDKWIARNLPRLRVKVAMGIGGSLDFLVGVQRRAPRGWQRLGLEWLYRLIREPWRWRRMTRLPRFVLAVLRRGARGPARFEGPGSETAKPFHIG